MVTPPDPALTYLWITLGFGALSFLLLFLMLLASKTAARVAAAVLMGSSLCMAFIFFLIFMIKG